MNEEALAQRYPELAEIVDGPEFVAIALAFQAKDRELDRLRAQLAAHDETHVWTNIDWKERAERAEAQVLAYESADSYVTSCTSCAGHLDRERQQEERAERAERELERRITADAEALADQTLMKGLTVEKGKLELNLIPPREIVAVWVHAAREMIGDAENYVEMEVKLAGEVERFAFVLQRVGKLTPHEARQQAEAAIARARAYADSLCHEPHPTHDHLCPDDVRRGLLAALEPKEDQ